MDVCLMPISSPIALLLLTWSNIDFRGFRQSQGIDDDPPSIMTVQCTYPAATIIQSFNLA